MVLEFKLCEVNEDCSIYNLMKDENPLNEFIIVGEKVLGEEEYYQVQQLTETGLTVIGGLNIQELSALVLKSDLKTCGDKISTITIELDIPKEYLTMDIIEDIQRLNN